MVARALGVNHAVRDQVVAEARLLPRREHIVREVLVRLLDLSNLLVRPGIGLDPVLLDERLELGDPVALGDGHAVGFKPAQELLLIPRLVGRCGCGWGFGRGCVRAEGGEERDEVERRTHG